MNDKHLNMIKILTDKYIRQEKGRTGSWSADFIRSKGEGQIFLLHGPPGVGKTYTAECISELTRKLYLELYVLVKSTNSLLKDGLYLL